MAHDHPLPTNLIPQGDICVPLIIPDDPDYIALLVRAVRMLELDRHYIPNANHDSEVVREQWRTRTVTPLVDALAKGLHCGGCMSLMPFHSSIDWFPNNPYTEPNKVGDGYIFPSWYIADTVAGIVYDAEMHAAITSVERIPSGSWPLGVPASGWPRFRVNFSGTGVIELHFSSIHWGSLIQIQVDDDILGMEWVDVNQHALGIPPETANISVVEREITTPGDHHIDCTIIPTLGSLPVPINFGGGLVKVELCGFTPQFPGTGDDLNGLLMRLTELCGMEFSTDGGVEWQAVTDWDINAADCFLGPTGADGTDGIDGIDGTDGIDGIDGEDGQTANEFPPPPTPETDEMCGAAWYIAEEMEALLQAAITDAETITLEEFLSALLWAGGFDGSLLVLLWDWLVVTVDATLSAQVALGLDHVAEHLYCTDLDLEATKTLIAADTEYSANARTGWQMMIDALDDGWFALRSFIGAQDDTRDCSSFCPGTWCYEWLDGSTYQMTAYVGPGYNIVITATDVIGDCIAVNTGQYCDITITFLAPVDISKIAYDISLNPTRGTGSDTRLWVNGGQVYYSGSPQIGDTHHEKEEEYLAVNTVRIACSAASYLISSTPDGDGAYSYIRSIIIDGAGDPAPLVPNC